MVATNDFEGPNPQSENLHLTRLFSTVCVSFPELGNRPKQEWKACGVFFGKGNQPSQNAYPPKNLDVVLLKWEYVSSLEDNPFTWRIIPISMWLIIMASKSHKDWVVGMILQVGQPFEVTSLVSCFISPI